MGTWDEFNAAFGEEIANLTATSGPAYTNWHQLCVCGHIDGYHGTAIGGDYRLDETVTRSMPDGEDWTFVTELDGCRGAPPGRGFTDSVSVRDPERRTVTVQHLSTCPCSELRAVAEVDRPNRYFNQRLPIDRATMARHPFMVGIRAFMTHLSRRKAAIADPDWAAAEFDRRFRWLPDARMCSVARCRTSSEDVWPVFVDGDPAQSELRCSTHR